MSHEIKLDLTVLVDIISNAAGMMILFTCLALLIRFRAPGVSRRDADRDETAKPINFPLAYLPRKNSLNLALKNGQLYRLPSKELLTEVIKKSAKGRPVAWLELKKSGVRGRLDLTQTALGFQFKFNILNAGGTPINSPAKLKAELDRLVKEYPPSEFFVMIHVWPENFEAFRQIREYLHEQKMEVGWHPRPELPASRRSWDIVLAVGEYNESFSSIKAQ